MKNVFYFILGISLVVLTSVTTASVMTVKPQVPKQTLVETFEDEYGLYSVEDFIESKQKSGWILKSVAGINKKNEYKSDWIVVMEKY
jgi:hypothetical protein